MKWEEKLISEKDGSSLHLRLTKPEQKPYRGIVQFTHGMAEHGGRYLAFMEYLSARGYVCVIHDHRGHGNSVGKEEDHGYFDDDSAAFIVEDLHQVSLYMKEKLPALPLILFGHSMGTLVARCYLQDYDDLPDAVILCGAPCKNSAVSLGLALEKLIEACKGPRHRSKLLTILALGAYERRFHKEGRCAWLSANKQNVAAYEADPACGFTFTTNGYRNLFLLLKRAFQTDGWQMKQRSLPILFVAGGDDPVIGSPQKLEETAAFLRARGYTDVQVKVYAGMRHELLQEEIRGQVYEDLAAWMENVQK